MASASSTETFVEMLRSFERKWQELWKEARVFEADPDPDVPKYFLTVAYPYVNSPQHIGHGRTYGLTDVHARYMRMRGYNVLYPQGFHYTGTPILAMSKRIKEGDSELIESFHKDYLVPEEKVLEFEEPLKLAHYFHEEIREGMKRLGFSIDWRREFSTIDPVYIKFIQWQFRTLQKRGYLTLGSHPVGWCPSDGNAVGMHDTKGDVEPEFEEVTLIKFTMEDGVRFPVVTYRGETIFGVTNLWINPDVEYLVAKVSFKKEEEIIKEEWLVSNECFEKLEFQGKKMQVMSKIKGSDLLGKYAFNPMTGDKIIILPASFVDPNVGTGLVMSVPGHAPYDYIALLDLESDEEWGEIAKGIEPISMIAIEGYSDLPAKDAIERLGVQDQEDPLCETATKEVYKAEFFGGILKENTGDYAGLEVPEAKDKVKQDLIVKNDGDIFYEMTNAPVYCRCGTQCVVKIVEDQWFINYGDSQWKSLTFESLERMRIFPEDLRQEFRNVFDWLREKACARKSGLGTPLPFDPSWIIESLSDSTIYMSFYTISKYLHDGVVSDENFSDEVFDYVFLGEGDLDDVVEKAGVPINVLKQMRDEFIYWYPLDARHSGRDLVPNHLSFMVFNHVAIFPREHWVKGIVVNGSVLMGGEKMSKSMGNIIPIRKAVELYSADLMRTVLMASAGLLTDADFNEQLIRSVRGKLERLYNYVKEYYGEKRKESEEEAEVLATFNLFDFIDKWLFSAIYKHVNVASKSMENCETRDAIQHSLYLFDQDVSEYLKMKKITGFGGNMDVMMKVLSCWVSLMAPFTPHLCEELWEMMGEEGFVSQASWPEVKWDMVDDQVLRSVQVVKQTIDDIKEIAFLMKDKKPKIARIILAPTWLYEVYDEASVGLEKENEQKEIMKKLMENPEMRKKGKIVASLVSQIIRERPKYAKKEIENEGFNQLKMYISKETGLEIELTDAEKIEKDPLGKVKQAKPGKPALYLE